MTIRTGIWGTMAQFGSKGTLWSASGNETVPTPQGTTPNNIMPAIAPQSLDVEVNRLWASDIPLIDVVTGCRGQCKATTQTPAMFATACTSHQVQHDYLQTWDLAGYSVYGVRP